MLQLLLYTSLKGMKGKGTKLINFGKGFWLVIIKLKAKEQFYEDYNLVDKCVSYKSMVTNSENTLNTY